jgi:hypothetical protein
MIFHPLELTWDAVTHQLEDEEVNKFIAADNQLMISLKGKGAEVPEMFIP